WGEEFVPSSNLAVCICGRAEEKRQEAGVLQDTGEPTLNFLLGVRGDLRPEMEGDGRSVRFVDAEGIVALTYAGLTVRDADGRALPARFEAVSSHRGEEANVDALR